MKKAVILLALLSILFITPRTLLAHCGIPCGIYDDKARIASIEEHIATIEKSIKEIEELSKAPDKNYNQIVRWVNNKEAHAGYIQEIVSQYFMTQRIKPVSGTMSSNEKKKYIEQLTLLHEILVYAMKAKQTTDLANAEKLRSLLGQFREAHLGSEDFKPGKRRKYRP